MRLRTGFVVAIGRALRICIVARFSTDDQKKRRRSNTAQVAYVKKEMTKELQRFEVSKVVFFEICDEAFSGELRDRPGIDKLKAGIQRREWDVIVCEDSSRLYRHPAFCYELVALAVDQDIRVICLGDDVDTAERDWEQRLHDAQSHHSKDNAYLRTRLARSLEDLWEINAAVGPLRAGYRRRATNPKASTKKEQGPFFDEVDPIHSKCIRCAFQLVASRRDLNRAARYLTSREVPKRDGMVTRWTRHNIRALIRNEVYRGVERYGVSMAKQSKMTGKTKQLANIPENVKTRSMPHLRIISDGLWHRANQVITERRKGPGPPRGKAHPLFGIPRESATPMSAILYCDVCKGKMYSIGPYYRCGCVHSKLKENLSDAICWNHATAPRKLTHERIYGRVLEELIRGEGQMDVLLDYFGAAIIDSSSLREEQSRLETKLKQLRRECQNLGDAIQRGQNTPKTLVDRIVAKEEEIARNEALLIDVREEILRRPEVPTRESLLESLRATAAILPKADLQARELLKDLLDGPVLAVPYRLLGTDSIVLRAHFTLNLVALGPDELRERLRQKVPVEQGREVGRINCVLDLFTVPRYVTAAAEAFELSKQFKFEEVGRRLGFSKRTAVRSKRLGEAMAEAGVSDPYLRQTEAPATGSRWYGYRPAS